MGISLEQWRVTVGNISCPSKHFFGNKVFSSKENCSVKGLIVIAILLLIGGVEWNPGPLFLCKACDTTLPSVRKYVRHQMIHAENSKFRFSCPYVACRRSFTSAIALQNHIYRSHGDNTSSSISSFSYPISQLGPFVCKNECCKKQFSEFDELVRHTRSHVKEVGSQVQCPFKNCSKLFKTKNAFNIHLCRIHPKYLRQNSVSTLELGNDEAHGENIFTNELNNIVTGSNSNEHMSTSEILDTDSDCNDKTTNLKDLILKFYLKLEAELLLSSASVKHVSDSLQYLLELSHLNRVHFLTTELKKQGLNNDAIKKIMDVCTTNDQLYMMHHSNVPEKLNSRHHRLSNYKTHFNYIEPKSMFLGNNVNGKDAYLYYIPIRKTLEALFCDNNVQHEIEKEINRKTDVLMDFKDGLIFRSHEILSKKSKSLHLFLYQDAFELVNPLGSARGIHKIVAFYFSLGNLHPLYRSKLDSIYLIALVKEKDYRHFGQEKCLGFLLNELLGLESGGIIYKGEVLPVILGSILGDNLGSHGIGGFLESFSSTYFCRYCEVTRADFLERPFSKHELRNVKMYEKSLRVIEKKK